jgi:virulence factor Mce-like protein
MVKEAPSLGRILAMVVFALTCFGLLLFLWLSFGGAVPLKPKSYEAKASIPEATTLAQEADVRMAGVRIGKVKKKELQKRGRTLVTLEIEDEFAPIPADAKLILRQKTLLGETYVEITPGSKGADKLPDGGTLKDTQVEPTVELDEIFAAFDPATRRAFQAWVKESANAIRDGREVDLNAALGNLEGFAVDGAGVLEVLDKHERSLKQLVRNTGVVFGALNERDGELRQLIVNSNNVFEATASRDEALAETFRIFPTFLDESKATLARLETFSENTHPLVRDLKPVARDLGPTAEDLGELAPDLEHLFRQLPPLIEAADENLPKAERFLRGAEPVFAGLHIFLKELNPILSFANWHQEVLAGFLTNGGAALNGGILSSPTDGKTIPRTYLRGYGIINSESMSLNDGRPKYERANSYLHPRAYDRAQQIGIIESFDCTPSGGEVKEPNQEEKMPPCFVQPPSLYDGKQFPKLRSGVAPNKPAPKGKEGTEPPG